MLRKVWVYRKKQGWQRSSARAESMAATRIESGRCLKLLIMLVVLVYIIEQWIILII